jgi:alanine-synthesizing transaminase
MFSSRLGHSLGRNRVAMALDARRAAGLPIIDLTLSNPTAAGFDYPEDLLQPLAGKQGLSYEPQPFGLEITRHAVSRDFARRGITVPASRIVMTASTSEAYSLLFKLLCDPGDAVLAPTPSYPLVEHLTGLDGVHLEHYSLDFHGRWTIDVDGLRQQLWGDQKRTRAVIMINPNNPTGSTATPSELRTVAALARKHDVALISDEVFADYSMNGAAHTSVLAQEEALSFALGGLSKSIGLPQVKLGWIGVGGPKGLVCEALDRLETICDAYLSVSTPVQLAAPRLLTTGAQIRAQIQARVRGNYAALTDIASKYPACSVLPVEAGWYAVCQVPAVDSEEAIVLALLDSISVLVHPGYFFDFEREAFLVVSLLPHPEVFSPALQMLFREIGRLP